MKLQFLETSYAGLRWMQQYFRAQPQLDEKSARASYKHAKILLKDQPYLGHVFDGLDGVYEYKISKTVFSILYTIRNETIFIIDIRDSRGLRNSKAINQFERELREKLGL